MPRKRTDYIVIHCTATREGQYQDVKSITAMHKARGFASIGYHYLIGLDGTIWKGRTPDDSVGAGVAGYNSSTLHVCYVGGLDAAGNAKDTRTPAQRASLAKLCRDLQARYTQARILGHRDLSPDKDHDGVVEPHEWIKQCPCFSARAWAAAEGLKAAPGEQGSRVRVKADAAAFPPGIVKHAPAALADLGEGAGETEAGPADEPQSAAVPALIVDLDPLITPASDRDVIRLLQRELKRLNYYDGELDGKWVDDGLTDMAVMAVQKRLKLPIDGAAIRLSSVRSAPAFVVPTRENAGVRETRKADTPAGNTVRFWDRLQAWAVKAAIAIGIPVGGSAIEQAEGGVGFVSRIKSMFEPFGGLSWLFTGYTPWLVVIGGVVVIVLVGQSRKKTAARNHRTAATS